MDNKIDSLFKNDDSNQREQWSLTQSDNNSSYRKLKNEELYELRENYYHKWDIVKWLLSGLYHVQRWKGKMNE